jgi:nitrogen fixation protein
MPALFLTSCGSSVEVKKLGDKNTGIPYYLPRPYLLITSGISTTEYQDKVTETKTEKPDGTKINEKVTQQVPITANTNKDGYSVKIIYLPDLRTKYGITIKPGNGTSDTKITLANGWQLTSLAATTDTKVPETITATAGLVSAVGGVIPKAFKTEEKEEEGTQKVSVRIYEMVWDRGKMKFDIDNPVFEWPIPGK